MGQWLTLYAPHAGGADSIPGQRAETPGLAAETQNTKQKQYHNKFQKDFLNGPHQLKKT